MDEIKLNTFLTVSECGSFTKAAEQLFLSPISVKKQIDSLENELGVSLFIRKATGCKLSPLGEAFLPYAHRIIKDIDNARMEIENSFIKSRGEIIAGHNINFNYRFIGSLSTGFSETHSNCIIQFQKFPRNQLIELLVTHKINCVFAESSLLAESKPEIVFHPLVTLPVFAIMAKNHPLSDRQSLSIADLADQELYSTLALGNQSLELLRKISGDKQRFIEETDRNVLFNRIVKGAIEIYPRQFSYYHCVPLDIYNITIGIYTLRSHSDVITNMVEYTSEFVRSNKEETEEIM